MYSSSGPWRAIVVGLICWGGGGFAVAQDVGDEPDGPSRPWMLGFAVQVDNLDSDSLYGTFNWAVAENTWLFFSAGRSVFTDGLGKLESDSMLAGFDHTFGRWGLGLDVETWGDSQSVEATDIRGSVHFGGERFRVYLEWEDRDVQLSPLITDRINLDVTGEGIGARLRFDLTDNWRVYLRGMRYDYEWSAPALSSRTSLIELCTDAAFLVERCEQLQQFVGLLERRNLFVQSTLANNSFLDSEVALSMEWELGNKLINLHLNTDRAADPTRSQLDSIGASILFPLSWRTDLELSIGRSDSDAFQSSTYGGLFFLLYGG